MNSDEYIELCKRTEPEDICKIPERILHGAMGCCTEAGELLDAVKKNVIYGKNLDTTNIVEELGDMSWYMSIILDDIGISWEEIWHLNIKKLRKRFPEKFTQKHALERDLNSERNVLEGKEE